MCRGGLTDDIWAKRTFTSHKQWENYALYNAPAGTLSAWRSTTT